MLCCEIAGETMILTAGDVWDQCCDTAEGMQ